MEEVTPLLVEGEKQRFSYMVKSFINNAIKRLEEPGAPFSLKIEVHVRFLNDLADWNHRH